MIDPNREITAVLMAQEWNVVLETLASGGPWRAVNPVIIKLAQQLERGQAQQQAMAAPGSFVNGLAAEAARN